MMEPLLSVRLCDNQRRYSPCEELSFECQVDAVDEADLQAVELSVLWYTEGKGDEDLGVHFFERRKTSDEIDLRELHRASTILPRSPLSYDGKIVKIRWCVRARCFLKNRRHYHQDFAFQLCASDE
jgi:hypothetical protein